MELVKKFRKDGVGGAVVELTYDELDMLISALRKEQTVLQSEWNKCTPSTPEELLYRILKKEEAGTLRNALQSISNRK